MNSLSSQAKQLHHQVKKLVQLHQKQQEQHAKLFQKLEKLHQQLEEQKLTINKLQESNKVLKLAKPLPGEKNNTGVKAIINELVREIDKCKALLNQ